MKKIGIIVIVLGLIMTLFTGFTLITEKEVLDVGPLEINREEKTPIYWSPITGLVLIGIGGVMVFAGKKK
jgi:hypothetical protein